jgi:hypothetical protein
LRIREGEEKILKDNKKRKMKEKVDLELSFVK